MPSSTHRIEFGDFQTPPALAETALRLVTPLLPAPELVVEPTCGRGAFLHAAGKVFPDAKRLLGLDISPEHLRECRAAVHGMGESTRLELHHGDFFQADWTGLLGENDEPLLVIGNPPWVTNSVLGRTRSRNTPPKRRQPGMRGIEALTGRSNFDISEAMLVEQLHWFDGRGGVLAVLVKESVARKVLTYAWRRALPITSSKIHRFDAARHFGAATGACLLIVERDGMAGPRVCPIYPDLTPGGRRTDTVAYRDNDLVRDPERYDSVRHLRGNDRNYVWRSGLKHDCVKVMELSSTNGHLENGFHQRVDIEMTSLYPLFKSSDIMGEGVGFRKWVIVTQQRLDDDPAHLANRAPKTWKYLNAHRELFDRRASSIYRGRAPFSMFGIGVYTFAPWKVAVPGLGGAFLPRVLSPVEGKPPMLDDTAYFLPCSSEGEARFLREALNTTAARDLLSCFQFADNKRPIRAETLRRLHIGRLTEELGRRSEYDAFLSARGSSGVRGAAHRLF